MISVFVYARMSSARLRNKPLSIVGRDTLIQRVLARAKAVSADHYALLTTQNKADDAIETVAVENGFDCYRGSESDVLQRTVGALREFESSSFVRVNGDSPFFEPSLVNLSLPLINDYLLITNLLKRSFPYGVAVEVVNTTYFLSAAVSVLNSDREHVTSHLYRRLPRRYLSLETSMVAEKFRLAIDTPDDLARMKDLIGFGGTLDTYWSALRLEAPMVGWSDQLGNVQKVVLVGTRDSGV